MNTSDETDESMSSSSPLEFQAVVLAAGSGSRFTDVTANKVKCLLPIGNFPMIWYPLQMLHRAGFVDVVVVVHDSVRAEVAAVPKKYGLEGLRLDLVSPPPNVEDFGTADALRLVHPRLSSQRIMIVSSDLVTDVPMHNLTDLHRVHGAAVTALFAKSPIDHKSQPIPGPKSKPKKGGTAR